MREHLQTCSDHLFCLHALLVLELQISPIVMQRNFSTGNSNGISVLSRNKELSNDFKSIFVVLSYRVQMQTAVGSTKHE